MLQSIKDFIEKHKISAAIVGTAIVLSTAYGSCSYDYVDKDVTLSAPEQGEQEDAE
tara:strand:+ start:353 stop:520 length:168 start_codon:yes stop_codon:yes gene_type:complete